jgi:hypothetical protein
MLIVTADGEVTPEDAVDVFERAKADSRFRPGMPMLVDGRSCLTPTASDVRLVVAGVQESAAPLVGRVAVLIQSAAAFGMARMAQILLSGMLDLHVTYDEDDARAKLAGSWAQRAAALTANSRGTTGPEPPVSNEGINPNKRPGD